MGEISSSDEARTLVLVGRTGNGKSATGNSILGRKAFKSRASSSGVTSTCELQKTVLRDGQSVNVIDTPGLFATGNEFAGKEIVKCIDMAKDGIHAIVIVLSVRTCFSEEEGAALSSLQNLFGSKIVDYMIVVFTGGDELEENDETLEDYLGRECAEPIKEILAQCGNRYVLFDNKTRDETKRFEQVQQLLLLVNMVISQNGGRPYTNELFTEAKEGAMKLRDQQREADLLEGHSKAEMLRLKMQMRQKHDEEVESKMKEVNRNIMPILAEEQTAKYKAEENDKSALNKVDNEIQKLRQDLAMANRRISRWPRCPIL